MDTTEVRVVLRAALARLSRRQRAVLVLRFFEDMTEAQTSELLSISIGTVKSHTGDALTRLRQFAPDLAVLYAGPAKDGAHVRPSGQETADGARESDGTQPAAEVTR